MKDAAIKERKSKARMFLKRISRQIDPFRYRLVQVTWIKSGTAPAEPLLMIIPGPWLY